MPFTAEERFRFDLTGFLVRPAILSPDEVAALVDQVDRIHHNPESLSPEQRNVPGGPSSVVIDHPKVLEVLHEVIGPDIRLEGAFSVWREKGVAHAQGFHQGGSKPIDPIFGYRVHNGEIYAGMVRVVIELTDVKKEDGATSFIIGSHKANFPLPPEHESLDPEKRSEFFTSYECPAGSAIFFSENLIHAGPPWRRDKPRIAILYAYSHYATNWHRMKIAPEIINGLPREKQAYFREVWALDFGQRPFVHNSVENFIKSTDPVTPSRFPEHQNGG